MRHNSLDNMEVEVDNSAHGKDVVAQKGIQDESLVIPVLAQVIIATGD